MDVWTLGITIGAKPLIHEDYSLLRVGEDSEFDI